MFLILVASNAMDGTYLAYKPPFFQEWERGVWARGTWGMNDEWASASGPPGPVPPLPPIGVGAADILRTKRHRIGGSGGRS